MTVSLASLQKLMSLRLSTEQMEGVIAVLAEELKPLEAIRKANASRQRHSRASRDCHASADANNTATPRDTPVEDNISKPSLLVEESKKEEKGNLSVSQKAPSSKPPSSDPEGFAEFWAAYPKRAGNADRFAASKGFRAASKRVDPQTIIAGARAYAAHCDVNGKTGTEFVRQARTWLNAQGWTENYETNQHRQKFGSIAGSAAIIDAALAAEEAAIREEEERQRFGEAHVDELPRLRQVN